MVFFFFQVIGNLQCCKVSFDQKKEAMHAPVLENENMLTSASCLK